MSFAGCGAGGKLPAKSSKEYAEVVSAFYTGLAALQVGDDVTAESKLAQVTQLAPGEPAGWGNWGVLAFRQRNFDVAAQRYDLARELAPKNDQIYYLLGILQSTRGNSKEAIADWRKAVAINPQNYRAAYQLALEVEREGGPGSDAEFESLIQNILKAQPDNLAAWLELARAAAKRGDAATLKSALAQISARASQWPTEVQQQLAPLQAAVGGADMHAAATRTAFLRNTLMRVAEFRESLAVLQAAPGEEAEPFTHFLRLESPAFVPAAAD
jgi:predicted Zn-dependent protease